jgi:hypothetical protein
MKIKEINEMRHCENNNLAISIYLIDGISKDDLIALANDDNVVSSADFPIPYFKIINQNYIIRGSIDVNKITIDFNSASKQECDNFLQEIILRIR